MRIFVLLTFVAMTLTACASHISNRVGISWENNRTLETSVVGGTIHNFNPGVLKDATLVRVAKEFEGRGFAFFTALDESSFSETKEVKTAEAYTSTTGTINGHVTPSNAGAGVKGYVHGTVSTTSTYHPAEYTTISKPGVSGRYYGLTEAEVSTVPVGYVIYETSVILEKR